MKRLILASSLSLSLVACGERAPEAAAAASAAPAADRAAFSGAPPLDDVGAPRFQPGLYRVTQTDGPGAKPEVKFECVGAEANEDVRQLLTQTSSPDCKVSKSSGPRGLKFESHCLQDGLKNTLKLSVVGSASRYKMDLALAVTTPNGKQSLTEMTSIGERIGECPAGVAPGETVKGEAAQ